jgi:hypothetical protein
MGSSTSTTNSSSTTNPWEAAQPFLKGVLGQLGNGLNNTGLTGAENNALNTIEQNAGNAGQFTGQLTNVTNNLLNGGGANAQSGMLTQGYQDLQRRLGGIADGNEMGANSGLKPYLDSIAADTTNQVNGMFAGAGRDFSGMNMQTLARGIMQGQAPVVAQQYNQDKQNQIGAANALYGASNTTGGLLTGLNQMGLANQQAGAQLAPSVLESANAGSKSILEAEAARRGIPIQALGLLAQIGIPIGGLGQQTSGTSTTTKNPSILEQLTGWKNLLWK